MVSQAITPSQSVVLDLSKGRVFRLRKSVMTSARLINDRLRVPANNPCGWRYSPRMITFTYRDGVEWKPEHLTRTIEAMQAWAKRLIGFTLPYLWVMELTKKGRPHYHLIVWAPCRFQVPKPDKRGWWRHGMTKCERVRNAVGYVAKYASKFASKDAEFPRGARIHGAGGLLKSERRELAWWKLPKDLRQGEPGSCVWRRAPGGGWYNPETRERTYSAWRLVAFLPGGKYAHIEEMKPDPEGAHMREHMGWRTQVLRDDYKHTGAEVFKNEREGLGRAAWSKVIRECWGRWKRASVDLQDDLTALLETDRVQWVVRIERLARLTPGA